jgi:uncharacterized surface protein with fasciclin (FAS1) repeats
LKPVHLSTCVWGPWHLDMLTCVVWPCLLAEGNLPALTRQCSATHRICTTRRDQAKLRELEIFKLISQLVPIEFIDTPTENPEPQFHMDRFVVAMQEARDAGAIFFNLWPDVVFADCTLGNAAQAIGKGMAGCLLPSFRVVSETCVADVLQTFGKSPDAPISIPAGELVRLGVRHMHPLSATGIANAVHGRPDIGLMFRVPDEGLVSRTSPNWLFVDPQRLEITADGAITTSAPDPANFVHIVTDSDDLVFLSLAPLYKELDTFRPHHSNDALDIARLTMLPHVRVSPFIEPLDRVCVRLHYGSMTQTRWNAIAERSDAVFHHVRMNRTLIHLWELLKEHGCRQVARLISLAVFTLKLSPRLLIERPLTIFVPNDDAIAALPPGAFDRLIHREGRRDLLDAMLDHVTIADAVEHSGETEYRSANGAPIWIRSGTAQRGAERSASVLKELRSGAHRICIIDRVLNAGAETPRVRRLHRS